MSTHFPHIPPSAKYPYAAAVARNVLQSALDAGADAGDVEQCAMMIACFLGQHTSTEREDAFLDLSIAAHDLQMVIDQMREEWQVAAQLSKHAGSVSISPEDSHEDIAQSCTEIIQIITDLTTNPPETYTLEELYRNVSVNIG